MERDERIRQMRTEGWSIKATAEIWDISEKEVKEVLFGKNKRVSSQLNARSNFVDNTYQKMCERRGIDINGGKWRGNK